VHERLVEDWLTSVNELGYQLPFCEVLLSEGYTIIHVSTHGRGEHGKDIVARSSEGVTTTFKLKGGDIRLRDWREMREEVAELVQLPVRLPGVSDDEAHIPHLVTNGEIRGDALESIVRYTDQWERNGAPRLQVWAKHAVLKKFVDAQGSFLLGGLQSFKLFVQLYVSDFRSPFPAKEFAELLEPLAQTLYGASDRELRRQLPALALVASYIVERYEREQNYVAAVAGWTMVAAAILHVAEKDSISPNLYRPTLSIVHSALVRNLEAFATEILASENFLIPQMGLADPHVYGARVSIVLGWLSVWALERGRGRLSADEAEQIERIFVREYPARRLAGEVDWPFLLMMVLYLDRAWLQYDAEEMVISYVNVVLRANYGDNAPGVPPPYWSHEKVLKLANGMLAPYEREHFTGHTYTMQQALDVLVRRLRRQAVRVLWPAATKLDFCDFQPDHPADYFLWRAKEGNLLTGHAVPTVSWSEWRTRAAELDEALVPRVLLDNPEWVLPFLLAYPHRANAALSALAEVRGGSLVKLRAIGDEGQQVLS
jgi:hypothetical protein